MGNQAETRVEGHTGPLDNVYNWTRQTLVASDRDRESLTPSKRDDDSNFFATAAARRDSLSSLYSESAISIVPTFPNAWARVRRVLREPFAEFLGTMLMIMLGNGVSAQVTLSENANVSPSGPKGGYLCQSVSREYSLSEICVCLDMSATFSAVPPPSLDLAGLGYRRNDGSLRGVSTVISDAGTELETHTPLSFSIIGVG